MIEVYPVIRICLCLGDTNPSIAALSMQQILFLCHTKWSHQQGLCEQVENNTNKSLRWLKSPLRQNKCEIDEF